MKSSFVVFFLCLQSVFSQTVLRGKIVSDVNSNGISIVNYSTKETTVTSENGLFAILAKPSDILIITSSQIEGKEIKLNQNSFNQNPLVIQVTSKTNLLDEVKVNSISTQSLGIVSSGVKKYTPAERKIITAGKFKWYSPLLIPLGGMSVDGLINQISGRTKMLKKELEVEKREIFLEKLAVWFDDDFYTQQLKIPTDTQKAFNYLLWIASIYKTQLLPKTRLWPHFC